MYNPNDNQFNQNNQNSTGASHDWKAYDPNYHTQQFTMPNSQTAEDTTNSAFYQSSQVNASQSRAAVKKQKSKGGKITAFVLAGLILSCGAGFCGSVLAQTLFDKDSTNPPVLQQSIVNTSNQNGSNAKISDVAAATVDSVVEITTETVDRNTFLQQYTTTGAGSGVVLTSDGYIITNHHVIDGASTIKVTLRNGTTYDATLVGSDADSDIAVVKIDASDLHAAVLGDSDQLVVGEQAIAIGNPLGQLGGSVTEGIISALDREITIGGKTMHLLQTSAAINPGNSGGGLFNENGELVGIVNAKTSEAGIEGLGFAIPINTAKDVAQELISHGYVSGKVRLGVSLIKIPDEQTALQYGVQKAGVYVAQVTANSDAYYAGLRAADLIKSVNGTEISETQDVKNFIEEASVGDVLKFVVDRNGQEMEIDVTLSEYNSNLEQFNNALS